LTDAGIVANRRSLSGRQASASATARSSADSGLRSLPRARPRV